MTDYYTDANIKKFFTFAENRQIQRKRKSHWWINLLLFLLTVITTTLAGAFMNRQDVDNYSLIWFFGGLKFSVPLLFILGIHEMGHYIASKVHRISATLPYFIPAPTLIGTFGAFIKIKEPIIDRKALMDIGAAGPLSGFFAAIPILIYGLIHSSIVQVQETTQAALKLGDSLILQIAVKILFGKIPDGYELYLSPMAFAAWLGFFVTSLNLIPIGQLDGGHIAYAMLGQKAYKISRLMFVLLIPLGFFWLGWLFWALLLFFLLGLKHPPLINPNEPIGKSRKIVGYICLAVFILTFTPVPFSM
ncbi:site-2 protease family protein [bacterium]|nr:site-2 protease family protein [bacterium]